MNPEDGLFQAARTGFDQSLQNGAALGKQGVLGCAAGGPGAVEAQQVKREPGACWGLVSGWRRAGLGKVIRSCPVSGSTGPGSEGFLVCMCISLGVTVARMLCCINAKAWGHFFFSAVPASVLCCCGPPVRL